MSFGTIYSYIIQKMVTGKMIIFYKVLTANREMVASLVEINIHVNNMQIGINFTK